MLWPGMMSGMYIFSMYPPKKRGVASIQEILGASRRGFTGRDLGGHRSQDFLQEMMGFYMCFRNVLIICLISDIRNGASSSSPKRNGVKALPWPGPSHSPQKALPVLLVCGVVSWLQAGDVSLSFWKIAGQFCLWHLENLGKDKVHKWFLKVWDYGIWNSTSSVLTQTAIASRSHNNGLRSFERFTRGLSSQNWDQIICCDTFVQTVFLRILCAHVSCSVFQVNMWSQNFLIGQQIKLRIKVKIMVIIIIIILIILLLPPAPPRPRHHQQRHIVATLFTLVHQILQGMSSGLGSSLKWLGAFGASPLVLLLPPRGSSDVAVVAVVQGVSVVVQGRFRLLKLWFCG